MTIKQQLHGSLLLLLSATLCRCLFLCLWHCFMALCSRLVMSFKCINNCALSSRRRHNEESTHTPTHRDTRTPDSCINRYKDNRKNLLFGWQTMRPGTWWLYCAVNDSTINLNFPKFLLLHVYCIPPTHARTLTHTDTHTSWMSGRK